MRHGAAVIDLTVAECELCHGERERPMCAAFLADDRCRKRDLVVCRPCLLEAVKLIDEDVADHNRVLMKEVQP